LKGVRNDRQHAFNILHHVVIPESQDAISSGLEERVTNCIIASLNSGRVMPAIELNYDTIRMTRKVGEVRTNRRLPPKMCSSIRPVSKKLPELALWVGHLTAEAPGDRGTAV
jgi:hypothetical protein